MPAQGVLLVNLGSPAAPTAPAVRRYLREFLMDGRVLDAPWPLRFLIVHLAILPWRPRRSAEAYRQVWTAEGAPLIVHGRRLVAALQARVPVSLELAMRYQEPSIPGALGRLLAQGVSDLLAIPLFPHYAMSSYETAVVKLRADAARLAPGLRLQVQPPFFEETEYLAALAASAEETLGRGWDHLLFSFHGLPERHLRKSDPTGGHCLRAADCCRTPSPAHRTCYRAQCFRTVAGLAARLKLPPYSVAFQSRLGRDPWLQPFADQEIVRLASAGVKRLAVMCPAFVADCLETLEEMGLRGRESFLAAGGREFGLVPCLDTHPRWVAALERWIAGFLGAPRAADGRGA